MLRPLLRAYALVFLVCGGLFVFAERLVLAAISWAASLAGAPALAPGGPSLWLGLTGSLMAVISLLAWRLSRAPERGELWDALQLSKAISSGLFAVFAVETRNPVYLGAAAVDGAILAHLVFLRARFEAAREGLAPRGAGYEALFLRAADPETGRALWVRRARLRGADGTTSLVWAVFFDPRAGRAEVRRWEEEAGSWLLSAGHAAGAGPGASWKLALGSLGAPRSQIVPPWLRALGLPRGYVGAVPAARVSGRATLDGAEWDFAKGLACVGHVWAEGLGRGWSWAHAVFDGPEPAVVEALSAPLAPGLTATSIWLWRRGRVHAATGPLRLFLNSSRRDGDAWTFSARAGDLRIEGTVRSGPRAELEYEDARGRRLLCRNSSASEMTLRLSGPDGDEVLRTELAAVEHAEAA